MSRRRGYIKHFNDWCQSAEFQEIFARQKHESLILYFLILELMNQKSTEVLSISIRVVSRLINKRRSKVLDFISTLTEVLSDFNCTITGDELEFVLYKPPKSFNSGVEKPPPNPHTMNNEEMNNDKKNTKKRGLTFENDLERIAELYPRTDGLREGIDQAKHLIQTHNDLGALKTAIENYSNHVEANQIEFRFTRTLKRFIQGEYWRDWVNPSQTGASNALDKWHKEGVQNASK